VKRTERLATKSGASEVRQALAAFFRAMQGKDAARWNELVTDDFVAFDGGAVFHGDELFLMVQTALAAGRIHSWRLTRMSVRRHGGWALATYVNRAMPASAANIRWLESALLEQDESGWRLKFFHSSEMRYASECKPSAQRKRSSV
jgi:ketosteroid isomerase-like protein